MVSVAIVGMAVLLPGAPDLESYWRNLVDGVDAITDVPAHRWDPEFYDPSAGPDRPDRVYCRRGGFVDAHAEIDAARFGIMPSSVPDTEPDQLIALRVAAAAIADAGGADRLPGADRVGVVIGRGGYLTPGLVRLDQRVRTANQLVRTLRELLPEVDPDRLELVREAFAERLGPNHPEAAIGLVPNLAASRIANRLDLRGPAYTVDAACASSLVAVDHAVRELATGGCDVMLAGGVHHCHDITLWSVFTQLRALSRQQCSRPFDAGADGILIGEGTGVVVLKRLADAVRDDDRIYAVIRGTGVASDGRAASLFNPEPAGQARAVRRAWAAAGLDPTAPDAIGLLEAHGTATPAGDAAELVTVADVFGPAPVGGAAADAVGRAVIGSVKSMIGHTMPAAGVAGLVKAALAVHRAVLPPTLHCDNPRPELARTRFRPIGSAQPWEPSGGPRRAGVNAFGFGGINAHVVLEEAPAAPRGRRVSTVAVRETEAVLRLTAPDPAALAALLAEVRPGSSTGQVPSDRAGCRLGLVDPTERRLELARRVVAQGKAWRGRGGVWFSPEPLLLAGGRLAFVFPGLEAEFQPRVDDVAERFRLSTVESGGLDVGRRGAGVFAVGRLLERALHRMAIRPDLVAGHSLGEWTAMVSAGLYSADAAEEFLDSFDPDSVRVPGLVFAAIGAGAERVGAALADHDGVVLSHDNAPNQCVVCGPESAVAELVRVLRRQHLLCQVLPFRSGFHTPMLAPYLGPIRAAAERFALHTPSVPVWSATTAARYPDDPAEIRALFVRHLLEPVRFRPLIDAMYAAGARVFVQVGTGQLSSVIDDVLAGRDHLAVPANVPAHGGLAQLRRVATALWVEGADPDLTVLDGDPAAAARPALRLDLGGALLSLGDRVPELAVTPAVVAGLPSTLDQLVDRYPVAAELSALLRETAAGAAAVLTASRLGPARTLLRLSVPDMPYLLDHCFFRQRDGWPDLTDRWPVVPATTIIEHLAAAARQRFPGRTVTGFDDVRLHRWAVAAPATEVELSVTDAGPDRASVRFGSYARADAVLAGGYPTRAPACWRPDPATERRPEFTADRLYRDRWMFHGPLFQGVTELTALAERHVRGVLTTPAAPGALLDNVGQLLGYWIMASRDRRTVVFPVGMRRIRYFGPPPPVGSRLECVLLIRSETDAELVADAQLIRDGRVWAQLEGWVDRRFDSHPDTRGVERRPERGTVSRRQDGDWALAYERWPDPATRELMMRNHLGADERAEYERQLPGNRRGWLLARIAVKDTVRQHLWDAGAGDIFPAEVRVSERASGRTEVVGAHGRLLGEWTVAAAHDAEVGVAIARRGQPGGSVGIDVRALGSDPDEDRAATARQVAARQAVGRAEVASPLGPATGIRVLSATAAEVLVEVTRPGAAPPVRRRVRCTEIDNPDDLPVRRYVVAWTEIEGETA